MTKIYRTNFHLYRWFILCKRLYLYSHADSDADANTDMPILRFLSGRFPGFCQFRMEKKELALKVKNLYGFSYSLMHIRLLTRFPITTRQTLFGIYMFKGNNKNIRTRYETCLKLKLKNKYNEITLSNGVVLSLLLSLNVFFT